MAKAKLSRNSTTNRLIKTKPAPPMLYAVTSMYNKKQRLETVANKQQQSNKNRHQLTFRCWLIVLSHCIVASHCIIASRCVTKSIFVWSRNATINNKSILYLPFPCWPLLIVVFCVASLRDDKIVFCASVSVWRRLMVCDRYNFKKKILSLKGMNIGYIFLSCRRNKKCSIVRIVVLVQ